ncbi:MAG: hypothetical protein HY801_09145 [Candidatus Lindowbacteria bacterium]|nr:hypothetical protein [Candidatus Lindowbacteria bacterium]
MPNRRGARITLLLGFALAACLFGWITVVIFDSKPAIFAQSLTVPFQELFPISFLILAFLSCAILWRIRSKLERKSKKTSAIGCVIAGLIIWFGPALGVWIWESWGGLTRHLESGYLVVFFGQGLTFGVAMYFRPRLERLGLLVFPSSRILSRVFGILLGILFLYMTFLLYCIPAVFVKLSVKHFEEEGFILWLLIPVGFIVSVIAGIINSATHEK